VPPMQAAVSGVADLHYRGREHTMAVSAVGPDPEITDRVMLRGRKSRIYYLRRFFDYPSTLSRETLLKLGLWRTLRIGASYLKSALFPLKPEQTLEHFFINRFGRELYRTFFDSYAEKIWGVPCTRISAEWGAQRVRGLSILASVRHALRKILGRRGGVGQKGRPDVGRNRTMHPGDGRRDPDPLSRRKSHH